ncbi:unnamed protein product [Candida verbasci]|uniref:GDP/GTP exchange factor Sec2 N-terminal domain-containing protein n=1 Tax=Candida verbasci TaxID=1227364 RepID=A0A9W4TU67_9ASCO|nr:unnamed protein product [Candida verbasci]
MDEDYEKRLAEEVGNLSIRLVTAVNKQVELEEIILQLRKQNSQLKELNSNYIENDKNYKSLLPEYNQLKTDYNISKELKIKAEAENTKLKGEVEDLTASLFDEANTMVSNASRETHNFKIKNRKLYEEIEEKNIIINNLQDQLVDLKKILMTLEDQQKLLSTPKFESRNHFEFETPKDTSTTEESATVVEQYDPSYYLQNLVYSPQLSNIRLDLNNFNKDFKSFIYTLIKPDFVLDLNHLKNLTYFKHIWNFEIENSILHIPSLSSNNTIFNKWNKNKLFWNSLVEGRVQIEPIKGVNESFKLSYKGSSNNTIPVAIEENCSFCGEFRNDSLEHHRLYYYKIHDLDDKLLSSYPLCNYCLIKLRNLCDFFAKIRLIKSNIFKLEQNNKFDELSSLNVLNGNFSQFKRSSSYISDESPPHTSSSTELMNSSMHDIKLDDEEECKLIKIYMILIQIRVKIFWSKVGYWDNEKLVEANLDEINSQTFINLIPRKFNREVKDDLDKKEALKLNKDQMKRRSQQVSVNTKDDEPIAQEAPDVHTKVDSEPINQNQPEPTTEVGNAPVTREPESPEKVDIPQGKLSSPDVEESDNQAFEDSSEHFDIIEDHTKKQETEINKDIKSKDEKENIDTNTEEGTNTGLKRSNSKSKAFTKKMNKHLEQTLDMLAENMENDK